MLLSVSIKLAFGLEMDFAEKLSTALEHFIAHQMNPFCEIRNNKQARIMCVSWLSWSDSVLSY